MASKRITVSVPAATAKRIKHAAGRTHSVSAWVTDAVTRMLEEEDLRRRFLELCDSVQATPAEQRQAQVSFDRITGGKKTTRAKSDTGRGKTAA